MTEPSHVASWHDKRAARLQREAEIQAYVDGLRPKPVREYYDDTVQHVVVEYEARRAYK